MRKEEALPVLRVIGVLLLTAYLFFNSVWSVLFLLPYLLLELGLEKKRIAAKQKDLLASQFRDGLQCLLASLEAGYSIENSFGNACKDLRVMFQEKAPIVKEFERIRKQLRNGVNVEELLLELGERSEIEDIQNFAGIFITAKRTGGDVLGVIRSVTATLYQKQEVRREILTILLAKQLEVRIMRMMPYGILLYFRLFSPGFLDPLYEGLAGRMIMSVIFVFYVLCCKLADHMAQIEV